MLRGSVQEERFQALIALLGKMCRTTLDPIDGVGDSSHRIGFVSWIINSFEIGQETVAMEVPATLIMLCKNLEGVLTCLPDLANRSGSGAGGSNCGAEVPQFAGDMFGG